MKLGQSADPFPDLTSVEAACQLNRNTERDGRQAWLSDLRESGAIEQDADIVCLIHRDAQEASVIVAKNRNCDRPVDSNSPQQQPMMSLRQWVHMSGLRVSIYHSLSAERISWFHLSTSDQLCSHRPQ